MTNGLEWRGWVGKDWEAHWTTRFKHTLRIERGNYTLLPNKKDYFVVHLPCLSDKRVITPNGFETLSAAKIALRMLTANGQITVI